MSGIALAAAWLVYVLAVCALRGPYPPLEAHLVVGVVAGCLQGRALYRVPTGAPPTRARTLHPNRPDRSSP